MGIETIADVEESTEPPICPYKDPVSQNSATNTTSSFESNHADEKTHSAPIDQRSPLAPHKDIQSYHCLDPTSVGVILGTDLQNGLSDSDARQRLQRDGPNTIREVKGVSPWGILLRQVSNSLTIVSSAN